MRLQSDVERAVNTEHDTLKRERWRRVRFVRGEHDGRRPKGRGVSLDLRSAYPWGKEIKMTENYPLKGWRLHTSIQSGTVLLVAPEEG
jgi:hypothetical protein